MIRVRSVRSIRFALLAVATLLALPTATLALGDPGSLRHDGSVVLQVNTDVVVPAGAHRDVVMVVGGNATIEGEVNAVVVVDGTATVAGGRIESLVVAGGTADLASGAVVDEVFTLDALYHVAPEATVGTVQAIEPGAVRAAIAPLTIAMWAGFAITYLLAGLFVAAIAGSQLRRAGATLTREPVAVTVGAIAALIGLPVVVALLAISIVGIPAAIAVAVVAIPAVWFFGSLAVAVRIGDWALLRVRGRTEASHPVMAALLGLVVVGVLSVIPVLGFLVGLAGAGAAVVVGWRAAFGGPAPTPQLPQAGPVAA